MALISIGCVSAMGISLSTFRLTEKLSTKSRSWIMVNGENLSLRDFGRTLCLQLFTTLCQPVKSQTTTVILVRALASVEERRVVYDTTGGLLSVPRQCASVFACLAALINRQISASVVLCLQTRPERVETVYRKVCGLSISGLRDLRTQLQ